MATHEDDLKSINADIELLEAEVASNEEEMEFMPNPPFSPKRKIYLQVRNVYISERLGELRIKRSGKLEVIKWEKRTR